MKYLKSILIVVIIEFQRLLDHTWRLITGTPMLKRSMITPQVFLGGQYSDLGLKKLHELGITAIVNMRTSPVPSFPFIKSFKTLHLPTPDLHAPTIDHLLTGIEFIKKEIEQNGKVYIHCRLGEGRGPTMTIAYLMNTGLTFQDAHALVKSVRTFIRLTKAQKMLLIDFEKVLNGHKGPVGAL